MSAIPYRSRIPNSLMSGRGSQIGQGNNQYQEEEDDAPQGSNRQRLGMMSPGDGSFHEVGNQQGVGSQQGIGSGSFPFMNMGYPRGGLRGGLSGSGQRRSEPVPNTVRHRQRHGRSEGRLDRLHNWQQNMPPNSQFGFSGNFNGASRPRLGSNIPGFLPQQQAAGPPLGASNSALSLRDQLYQRMSIYYSGRRRNLPRGGGAFGRRIPEPSSMQKHGKNIPPWTRAQLQQQRSQGEGAGEGQKDDDGDSPDRNTSTSGSFDAYRKQMEERQWQRGHMGR